MLDGAVGVFCAVAGVQPQSETVWRQMTKYNVPRIAFVNKMDRVGADFHGAVESMRERLGANAHPIFLPMGSEEDFIGLIDLASIEARVYDAADESGMTYEIAEVPAEYIDEVAEYREKLIEALADFDDDLANKYLEGEVRCCYHKQHLHRSIEKSNLHQVRYLPKKSKMNRRW